ncbi:MAG TPA: DNA polymerase III subunit [archaeon]|nr:DNA polymerase III subunit [archaeon]
MGEENHKENPLGLTELLDKELESRMLQAALARDRLGGTLLFFGPDGSGKSSLAFWLAAAFNCSSSGGRGAPCLSCPACRKVETLNHPDVFWIFPLPGSFYRGERIDELKLAEVFGQKRSAPWLEIQFPEKSEHHLAMVRRIRTEASRSCYEGRRKVFVVSGADRLRIEASNAFLKLLEEPRPDVTLILCTERPSSLIPTILSRCQRLQVTRPRLSTCLGVLSERFGLPEDQARELLAAADGNLTAALRMKDHELFQMRKVWVEKTFQAVLDPGTQGCYDLVNERNGPMWNRGDFERYLAFLTQALRDVILSRIAGADSAEPAKGAAGSSGLVREYSARVADVWPLLNLLGRMVNLRDALDRNVNLRLLGWSILHKMREVAGYGC